MEAPMELILMKARTPNVLGKSHETPCQAPGMLDCGHETPVKKSSGIETKTISSITFSRYRTRHETVIPKKMLAIVYGNSIKNSVKPSAKCGKENIAGTAIAR